MAVASSRRPTEVLKRAAPWAALVLALAAVEGVRVAPRWSIGLATADVGTAPPASSAAGGAAAASSAAGPSVAGSSGGADPGADVAGPAGEGASAPGSEPPPAEAAAPKATPRPAGPPADVSKELQKPIYKKMSLSIGAPHAGRQVRAKKLRGDAALHVLKKGSDAVFGHPSLVLMLHRSAKQLAKKFPGSKLVVGDLSSEAGGPLVGHHSHQSGRDADVLFYARDEKGKSVLPKKFVQYDAAGKATDGSGLVFDDERNWLLVDSWSKDKRAGLKYVFVARWLRSRLIAFALKHPKYKDRVPEVSAFFLQPEGAEPHDDHFHVRIKCPAGEEKICVD
jgi:penicillin-insensitive murein endopeptidase